MTEACAAVRKYSRPSLAAWSFRFAAATAFSLFCAGAKAEVYDLFGGKGSASAFPGAKTLWTEPIVVNGFNGRFGIYLSTLTISRILDVIHPNGADSIINGGMSVMIQYPSANGARRLLLVGFPGMSNTLGFTLDIPSFPSSPPRWTAGLPMPADGTPTRTISFPARGSSSGEFETSASPEQASSELHAQMLAKGWTSVSGMPSGGGDAFISPGAKEAVLFSCSRSKAGGSKGIVFRSRLEGKSGAPK